MQIHKNSIGQLILLVVAILSLTLLAEIGTSHQRTSATAKPNDATSKQEGKMTASQREHSKLYKAYAPGGNLRELAASSTTDVEVVNGIGQQAFSSNSAPFNLRDYLREMARNSDAIVVGTVTHEASFLTADESFVFSDYDLNVEEILKDNNAQPIKPKSFTVTRPGGTVTVGGRAIHATDESLEPLALGNRYLLFLEFIPTTGAYKAFNSKGSFQLDGNKAVKLTRENLPYEMETGTEASSLISNIRR